MVPNSSAFVVDRNSFRHLVILGDMESKQPAFDVHWGVQQVYDFFKEQYNQLSFDGQGSPIVTFVNPGAAILNGVDSDPMDWIDNDQNAFANPESNTMFVGLSHPTPYKPEIELPYCDLGTIGHEFTHLVARNISIYGEAGALNESYADIIGMVIEHQKAAHLIEPSWELSWYVYYANYHQPAFQPGMLSIRSISDPSRLGNPSYYEEEGLWADPDDHEDDCGGIHGNCAVQNHMFYLLVTGGSRVNSKGNSYNIEQAVDELEACAIMRRALVYYGTKEMDYVDARINSVLAAGELFPGQHHVASINQAWNAVEVENQLPTALDKLHVGQHLAPQIYDLFGREVSHATAKGFYIINGKKVIR